MKINLQEIDKDQFMTHDHLVNGDVLTLVQPNHIGAKWSRDNRHFRSSLWNQDGELVSAGFPKFVNFGEKPEQFPVPTSLSGCTIMEKLDGSLLIVSKYKGNYILRTRGTVDAQAQLKNGHELELFKQSILHRIDGDSDTWDFSFLFEWLSPNQKIVLNYGDEPNWILVGVVNHVDYSLRAQSFLDTWANQHGLKRPETYTFSTVEDLLDQVELWKGKEGVCIYSKNGQEIHKVKAAQYLFLHRMKSELSNMEKVLDVWLSRNMPSYTDFYDYIVTTFDYELAEQVRGHISNICDGWKESKLIINHMNEFVTPLKSVSRKDAALKIVAAYGETNRSAFCFKLLSNKELEKDDYKKLIFQVLKR